MPKTVRKLIFVFAADSGLLNAIGDSAGKVLRLKGCSLCGITHGILGERKGWKECRSRFGVDVDYVHRDELSAELQAVVGDKLPAVVAETDDGMVLLLAPDVLDRCRGSIADFNGRLMTHAAMHDLEIPLDSDSTGS